MDVVFGEIPGIEKLEHAMHPFTEHPLEPTTANQIGGYRGHLSMAVYSIRVRFDSGRCDWISFLLVLMPNMCARQYCADASVLFLIDLPYLCRNTVGILTTMAT